MNGIVIPKSLQITMDDVGWFNGSDDRKNGGSARTAMPRRHCAKDYAAINELGKRLNMKINCAFVLGEWDDDNRLKKVKYLSKFGDGWNNAAFLGMEEMAAVKATVNASEYIDIAVHGLMHNYYNPNFPYSNSDYYYRENKVCRAIPEEEIRARLDSFFDMLDHHGINKKINSFIPPNFTYIWGSISHILKEYGIKYASTVFTSMKMPAGTVQPVSVGIDNGIVTLNRNINFVPWYEISTNLDETEPVTGIFGCHWPNILHEDPERHGEVIDSWVRYFERCANTFGTVLSRDIAFAASQSLYCDYARVEFGGDAVKINTSAVPTIDGLDSSFIISSRSPIKSFDGCEISVYQEKDGFINYRVIPTDTVITLK